MTSEALPIRPYARLLTMLGDQLIKNERIALVELIKNAYDADAGRVEVRFDGFRDDMTHDDSSRIVVRDDGAGMSLDTVRTRWMNPAAPQKFLAKQKGQRRTPGKQRIIQGEKGIGRFAILKLGRVITVTTRQRGAEFETVLEHDFSRFDDDFVSEHGRSKEIFLDEITIDYRQAKPEKLPGEEHGTVIEIGSLKGEWSDDTIKKLCRDVSNLTDPVSRLTRRKVPDRFEIAIFCNGEPQAPAKYGAESLKALIEDKAVLKIQGRFVSSDGAFSFRTGGDDEKISLLDPKITGLWVWRKRFRKRRSNAGTQMPIPFFGRGRRPIHLRRFRVPVLRLRLRPGHRRPVRAGPDGQEPAQGPPDLPVPGRRARVSLRRPGRRLAEYRRDPRHRPGRRLLQQRPARRLDRHHPGAQPDAEGQDQPRGPD